MSAKKPRQFRRGADRLVRAELSRNKERRNAGSARAWALDILTRRGTDSFVEDILEANLAQSSLSAPDRRLCQELVFGVVRWQATLDWLIHRKSTRAQIGEAFGVRSRSIGSAFRSTSDKKALEDWRTPRRSAPKPPSSRPQHPIIQNLLRLGLYQIFWLQRIPNHAAVHETVELAKERGLHGQARFVNAVLRGCLREADATRALLTQLKTDEPALGYSHPEWLVKRWQERWGNDATAQLMDWNNRPPNLFARVNLLKTDPGKLLEQWREEGVEYDFFWRDWLEENQVFELKSLPRGLAALPSFQQGLFYIQDPSTLLAVRELAPQPGAMVLDLCAAPGGKLTYAAQLMANQGRLIAHDISPERFKLIEENCARLGITCVELLGHLNLNLSPNFNPPSLFEARNPKSEIRNPKSHAESPLGPRPSSFDRILLDAPCSNTGVMRRRVELRWRLRPEEIKRLQVVQLDLLTRAAPLLKPGGVLVYSTCSLEPEENKAVVNAFLASNPAFNLETEHELLPFRDGVDGAYVVVMRSVK